MAQCAKEGCPTILPPGGGVRGYCVEHAPEAVIQALEHVEQSLRALSRDIADMDQRRP
jgi:hypothetical protein